MLVEPAILLAAMGITILEMSEVTAVGIAMYADSKNRKVFLAAIAGILVILGPTAVIGKYIAYLPLLWVRLISGILLLYFGLRLIRSSRRSVKFTLGIRGPSKEEKAEEKGLMYTAFTVGVIEAFEAAIVLVALYPNGYISTLFGLFIGAVIVAIAGFALHSQIRKVKAATMKIAVSAILLTFAAFWFSEIVVSMNDLFLIPIFIVFFLMVWFLAHWNLTIGKKISSESDQGSR